MKMTNQLKHNATELILKIYRNATGQLVLGAIAGCTAGSATMKIGKPIAFVTGIGFLAFHVANYNGLVKEDLIKTTANKTKNIQTRYSQKLPSMVSNVKQFTKGNKPFALGFIGGLLIGISA